MPAAGWLSVFAHARAKEVIAMQFTSIGRGNDLPDADLLSLRHLDRQWGRMYDIAISSRRWITPHGCPPGTVPGNGLPVPSARKWVAQRRDDQRWIIADSAEELAERIAADYVGMPSTSAPMTLPQVHS
jgi:hypothetical protein